MQKINLLLVICALFSFSASSAIILKIKGRKALIDLEGGKAERGDTFEALNLYGRALGLLKIKKVRRGKAIGILVRGKMGTNWILEPVNIEEFSLPTKNIARNRNRERRRRREFRVDTYGRSLASENGSSASSEKMSPTNGIGFTLGPHLNYVRVSEKVNVYGVSWKIAGVFDFFLMNQLGVRMGLGYQTLIAKGKNCGISNCHLVIHYPLASILFRGVFLQTKRWNPWLGIGGAVFLPMVDERYDMNLEKESFEKPHGAFVAAFGVDIHFQDFYIPVQLDFNWINPVVIAPRTPKIGSKELQILYLGASIGLVFNF